MQVHDVRHRFQGAYNLARGTNEFITVHHAAMNYGTTTGLEDVAAIARFHTDAPPKGRGWPGIGYHEVLAEETPNGPIACYIVSDPYLQRAHVGGQNHRAYGICAAANFAGIPADKWLDAIAERVKHWQQVYPRAQMVGHQDIALAGAKTECPGPKWREWRGAIAARIEAHDWPAEWGNHAPYNHDSGIATRWRQEHQTGRTLGQALTHEQTDVAGRVYQVFERGVVLWAPVAGAWVWR